MSIVRDTATTMTHCPYIIETKIIEITIEIKRSKRVDNFDEAELLKSHHLQSCNLLKMFLIGQVHHFKHQP